MNGSPSWPETPSVSTQNSASPSKDVFDRWTWHIEFSTSVWFKGWKVVACEILNELFRINRNTRSPWRSFIIDGRKGKHASRNRSIKNDNFGFDSVHFRCRIFLINFAHLNLVQILHHFRRTILQGYFLNPSIRLQGAILYESLGSQWIRWCSFSEFLPIEHIAFK